MPSFSNTLEHAIHSALALANERSHEFATLEHLLLALIDEPEASQVLAEGDGLRVSKIIVEKEYKERIYKNMQS